MKADFTLVSIGGLGNRINAICSVIVYCQQQNKTLKILWFKDQGLNCPVTELMSIDPKLTNVQMYDAKFQDFILRDRPRKKNFYIPKPFQYFLFDRRIYEEEIYKAESIADIGNIDRYKHIYGLLLEVLDCT